ncbi:hypothetical protein DL89DRAFT_253968 [Linderina pennispora]|uniref:Protein kinase domain-containing protein n=1 Tax=Linderina pennispora TaxID=61395 RepID=A0A1Y1WKK3_9FUNG|nr:uncharacterized protein DL89DRAFT_253968 [Linderina pennispora]ORX74077.1 hypothetical protein DL89DRAFT_253968 [Linderina pennispora]
MCARPSRPSESTPAPPQLSIDSKSSESTSALPYPDVAQYIANGGGQQDVAGVTSRLGGLSVADPLEDPEEYDLKVANIRVLKKLGEGSVGTVHKVEYVPKKKIMARKLMSVYPDETNHRQIIRELKLLKQCRSPHIVTFYGAYFSDDDDGQSIAICMEYCEGGSPRGRLQARAGHERPYWRGRPGQGRRGGAQRPGQSVQGQGDPPRRQAVQHPGDRPRRDQATFVGTSYYMAPERIKGDRYAVQSDVWSLGLTMIEVSQRQFPFPPPGHRQLSEIELLEYIIHMPVPEMDAARFSQQCCDFVRACLHQGARPAAHPEPAPRAPLYCQLRLQRSST